jgi:hypothetical protein
MRSFYARAMNAFREDTYFRPPARNFQVLQPLKLSELYTYLRLMWWRKWSVRSATGKKRACLHSTLEQIAPSFRLSFQPCVMLYRSAVVGIGAENYNV